LALISASYRNQLETLHSSGVFGTVARSYAPMVAAVINKLEVTHVLDYGCGSNLSLAKALHEKNLVKHKFKYQAYDPCVPEYAALPVPAELVACIDVLEHIEEDSIDEVLDHLQSLTEAVGVFSIDTGPAVKVLSDGRNAHVLQRPPEWWLPRLMCRFELQTYQVTYKSAENPDHTKFFVVVNSLAGSIEDTDGTKLSCQ
jgi:hypothetical protein